MPLNLTRKGFNYVDYYTGYTTNYNSLSQVVSTDSNSIAATFAVGILPDQSTIDYSSFPAEQDAAVKAEIIDAVSKGLSVIVRPLIDFYNAASAQAAGYALFEWREFYNPGLAGSDTANKFFASYKNMIMHYADIAHETGAEGISIGVELDQIAGPAYYNYWHDIITSIRAEYPELKITYGADWQNNMSPWTGRHGLAAGTGDLVTQISFARELDTIGIDAYPPLSTNANPSVDELIQGWVGLPVTPAGRQITGGNSLINYFNSVQQRLGIPLEFSEIGYRNGSNAAIAPSSSNGGSIDDQLQADLYQAFFYAWELAGTKDMTGVYFWNWDPNVNSPSPEYTPANKLAQSVVMQWFGGSADLTRPYDVVGTQFDDAFYGLAGNDKLNGADGNDTLSGGGGYDLLIGGNGIDNFIVDEGTDTIQDLGKGGQDIFSVNNGAIANATLAADWKANNLTKNNGQANIFTSGYSVDLRGVTSGLGFTIINQGLATNLVGSKYADSISSGLYGDKLSGGLGIDTFVIAGRDSVIKDLGNGGSDIINIESGASVKAYVTSKWIATSETQNNGQAYIYAQGNEVDLSSVFNGSNGFYVTNDGRGNSLTGSKLNDKIIGGRYSDIINGQAGDDTLTGGYGSDTFLVDTGTDTITDLGLGGNDVLIVDSNAAAKAIIASSWKASSESINKNGIVDISTKGFNVDLSAIKMGSGYSVSNVGSGARLTGSGLSDKITGGIDSDVINGGLGNDTLTGGQGKDVFVFNSHLSSINNFDTIMDFQRGDILQLDHEIFHQLERGRLESDYFTSNSTGLAIDKNDYLIYNRTTGDLFYDADGKGGSDAIKFANLVGAPTLSSSDFKIV